MPGFPRIGLNIYQKESVSTDGMTPGDHVREVEKITGTDDPPKERMWVTGFALNGDPLIETAEGVKGQIRLDLAHRRLLDKEYRKQRNPKDTFECPHGFANTDYCPDCSH